MAKKIEEKIIKEVKKLSIMIDSGLLKLLSFDFFYFLLEGDNPVKVPINILGKFNGNSSSIYLEDSDGDIYNESEVAKYYSLVFLIESNLGLNIEKLRVSFSYEMLPFMEKQFYKSKYFNIEEGKPEEGGTLSFEIKFEGEKEKKLDELYQVMKELNSALD